MVRMQPSRGGNLVALALAMALGWGAGAHAIYLDEDQNVTFRARIYSQAAIRLTDSAGANLSPDVRDVNPAVRAGQLIQHRNFFSPELDTKLVSYTKWMRGTFLDWLAPDDFRIRAAGWAFYDGIYDYGTGQFDRVQKGINPSLGNFNRGTCAGDATNPDRGRSCTSNAECSSGRCMPGGAWFLEGPKLREPANCPGPQGSCLVDSLQDLFPEFEVKEPRELYAFQRRINELYFSYAKGPFFLRLGRQAISWGESDTIALLDQTNPFDISLAAPGIFQDIDEARIPLWTTRASLNLFDTLGPLSSGFVEAYWVPGDLDTTTAPLPILTASPYAARGRNPQFSSGFPNETHQFVFFDHTPEKKFENSRYGFRFQTVLNRTYTLQAWMYRHFPQAPVARTAAPVIVKPGSAGARTVQPVCRPFESCSPLFVTELVHELTTVYGLAGTFFFEPADAIIRLNAQYFENEPGFIPEFNLNIGNPEGKQPATDPGRVESADVIRYEIGFDRFFFFRPLNPTHAFTLVISHVGAVNLDETPKKDFRLGPRKPNKDILGRDPVPDDFVQRKQVEAFGQITLLTDYLHGRLTPQVTWVQDARGTWVFHPYLTYRWADWLLFRLDYVNIGGEYQGPGLFRDKDQIALRATYQLN